MDLEKLIVQVRANMTAKLDERAAVTKKIDAVREACMADEGRAPTEAESDQVRAAAAQRDALDVELGQFEARIAELEAEQASNEHARQLAEKNPGAARAKVNEPRTYSAEAAKAGRSFFMDAFRAQNGYDPEVRGRLDRHMAEVRANGEMSERAMSTGGVAGLVIPQYLIDQAALVARAGRPTANIVTRLPLPSEGMSLIIPRGTTGVSAASQATENSAVSMTDEVWTNLTVPVVTIAGQVQPSRQLLERGGANIDQLLYADLTAAYMTELGRQVVSGSGASNQMLGILNTAGVNQATAFTAAATVATFYSKVAGQVNAVEMTRFMAPTAVIMHPQRWNWLLSQLDASSRPLVVPNTNGPFNAVGVYDSHVDVPSSVPVGFGWGLPIYTDANVPVNVGTGPEDVVIVTRKEDLLLWEDGDGMPRQLRFEQTYGNQLTTTLVAYGYAAFTAGRFPASVGKVGGNSGAGFGLVAPTF